MSMTENVGHDEAEVKKRLKEMAAEITALRNQLLSADPEAFKRIQAEIKVKQSRLSEMQKLHSY